MTIKHLISIKYTIRHTRECGYPGVKTTFYEFIKKESIQNNSQPVTATIIPSFIRREPQGHVIVKPKLLISKLLAGYGTPPFLILNEHGHRMRVKNMTIG